LVGKILNYLEFAFNPYHSLRGRWGALPLRLTCSRFSSLPTAFWVEHSCVNQKIFHTSLLEGTREVQDLIRARPVISDVTNCGHCDHTNRHAVMRCYNSLFHDAGHVPEYACQPCSESFCCVCKRYGMLCVCVCVFVCVCVCVCEFPPFRLNS
jgi:hypothetical protein